MFTASLRISALFAGALAMTACGTASDSKKPEEKKTTSEEQAEPGMDSEFDALPSAVMVKVPVDANGDDIESDATTSLVQDGSAEDDGEKAEAVFTGGESLMGESSSGGFSVSFEEDQDALAEGSSLGGYRKGRYWRHRPILGSHLVRAAAWAFTRPIVWTVRGHRYYRYNRPDCGCYRKHSSGGYVNVSVRVGKGHGGGYGDGHGSYQPKQPSYQPKQPVDGYEPKQPGYVPGHQPKQPNDGYVPPQDGYVPPKGDAE